MPIEEFFYVIRGRGGAYVNDEPLPPDSESMVRPEPGEEYSLEAGESGDESLQAFAPGE